MERERYFKTPVKVLYPARPHSAVRRVVVSPYALHECTAS